MKKVILCVDNRKEQAVKNKKVLESAGNTVIIKENLNRFAITLSEIEPDLILIYDRESSETLNLVRNIRNCVTSLRPVIIVISKSNYEQDMVNFLNSGADDFLSDPISNTELKTRIEAHLRRHFETETDEITGLLNKKIGLRYFKRTIFENQKWGALLIGINNFEFYKEIYGKLAAEKMCQTFSAIANTILSDKDDFISSFSEGEFLVVVSAIKAERIAQILIYSFEKILEKFYSKRDNENGFITLSGDERAENKVRLVSLKIGIITNEYKYYTSLNQAMHSLYNAKRGAETYENSHYIMERPQLSGKNSVQKIEYNSNILIIEPDEALSYLLETTAKIRGYNIQTQNINVNIDTIEEIPSVIILDAGSPKDTEGLEICRKFKNNTRFKKTNIIMTTVIHDKDMILNSGADLYLPKPFDIPFLFDWIDKLVKKYNE